MKKERILYFDVIKLVAVILVFTCHFTRSLEYYGINFDFKVLPDSIFSLYSGNLGVILFFIISGASLMYVYEDRLDLKKFYKKRFLGIYPMFWIAFIISFLANFYVNRGYDHTIPKKYFIFSILGCDGNAAWYVKTFYQVGEWFLSVIVLLYIVFPLLRKLVNDFTWLTLVLVTAIALLISFNYNATLPVECFFVNRIPEFVFGMIFMKKIKKVNLWMLIPSIICLSMFEIFQFPTINTMIRIYCVGVSSFLVLVFLFSHIKWNFIKVISAFISKYSYPIFLVHHSFMIIFFRNFWGLTLTVTDILILYTMTALLTLLLSYLLVKLTNHVLSIFQSN